MTPAERRALRLSLTVGAVASAASATLALLAAPPHDALKVTMVAAIVLTACVYGLVLLAPRRAKGKPPR